MRAPLKRITKWPIAGDYNDRIGEALEYRRHRFDKMHVPFLGNQATHGEDETTRYWHL